MKNSLSAHRRRFLSGFAYRWLFPSWQHYERSSQKHLSRHQQRRGPKVTSTIYIYTRNSFALCSVVRASCVRVNGVQRRRTTSLSSDSPSRVRPSPALMLCRDCRTIAPRGRVLSSRVYCEPRMHRRLHQRSLQLVGNGARLSSFVASTRCPPASSCV